MVCISFVKQLGFSESAVNKTVKNCQVIEENYGKCWGNQKYVKKSKSEELEETVCKAFHGVSHIILSCIMIWYMFSLQELYIVKMMTHASVITYIIFQGQQ